MDVQEWGPLPFVNDMLSIEDNSPKTGGVEEQSSKRTSAGGVSGGRLRVETPPPLDVQRAFIEYGLREALGAVVAPDTHDMVLAIALEHAGLSVLPAAKMDFRIFLEADLRSTLSKFFGLAAGEAGIKEIHRCLPHMFCERVEASESEIPVEVVLEGDLEQPNSPETIPAGILPSHVGPQELVLDNPYLPATMPPPNLSSCSIFVASDDPKYWQRVSAGLDSDGTNYLYVVVPVSRLATVSRALKVPNLPVLLLLDARGELNVEQFFPLMKQPAPFLSVLAWGKSERLADTLGDLGNLPPRWNTASLDADENDLTDLLKNMLRAGNQ